MSLLKIENLKKDFSTLEVLKGVSFELDKGDVVAIIGSSGSGKSTLLRILNFLETPTEGEMYLNDENLLYFEKGVSEKELRRRRLNFGLVFQEYNLFPHLTVFQNVILGAESLIKERSKGRSERKRLIEENKVYAIELLAKVGLSDKLDSYPKELSGGQKQRVAIARALALKPAVLCFDEPTSALDPELTKEVLNVIKNLKVSGMTMIVVTHEMEFARKVADKVIFMSEGIIEEEGAPEEVFFNPKSQKTRLFINQFNENFNNLA